MRVLERTSDSLVGTIELTEVAFSARLPDFGDILDVAPAVDGRLVVLDPMGPHVVVLESDGREAARFGGTGDGPGEFRASGLTGLVMVGDSVAVPDVIRERVTLFDMSGRVLNVIAVPIEDGLSVDWRGGGDGGLLLRRVSHPQRLERLDLRSAGYERLTDLSSLELPAAPGPLTALPVWCHLPDGRFVLGRTDQSTVRVLDGGTTTAVIHLGLGSRPVSDGDIGHIQSLLQQSLSRRLGQDVPADRARQLLEQTPMPEQAPLIAEVRCTSTGEVWVQRALAVEEMGEDILRVGSTQGWGSNEWDVVDLVAETVHRTTLAPGTRLTRVTPDLAIGYTTDDLGRKSPARWSRR